MRDRRFGKTSASYFRLESFYLGEPNHRFSVPDEAFDLVVQRRGN